MSNPLNLARAAARYFRERRLFALSIFLFCCLFVFSVPVRLAEAGVIAGLVAAGLALALGSVGLVAAAALAWGLFVPVQKPSPNPAGEHKRGVWIEDEEEVKDE